MAEPLRKNDRELPSNAPDAEPTGSQFNVHRYGNPHRRGSHWWFWILLIAVVVWFIVWGRGNGHKVSHTAVPVPASVPAPKNTVDVAALLSRPQQYIGKQIHLRDVLVQSANGTVSLFIGSSNTQQMLVILKKGSVPNTLQGKPGSIPDGAVVNITGTVEKAGSPTDLEHSAKIKHKEAEAVAQQGIVIEADHVDPQPM